ncbi:MAG: Gfo/Idh/MocA family oxidoreductase [Pseudomonadota bacterium]
MSDPVRLAIVGFGLVGQRHAAAFEALQTPVLAAIVEPAVDAQQRARDLGLPVYESLETLFASEQVDGIVLATPTPLHVEQGLACITHDTPVLIEKPIAVSAHDAGVLVDEADRRGVPVLVGHHRRYNGRVRAAKAALDAGEIGAVRAIHATCWFYKPDPYFAEAPWRTRKGAGPVSVNLVHDVDLLRHFCGEVESVKAQTVPSVRGFENEDLAAAILTFHSGAVATLSVSDATVSPWSWEFTASENPAYPMTGQSAYLIGGSTGALSVPDLRRWRHQNQPDWWDPMGATLLQSHDDDPLVAQLQHFADVIRGAALPVVSGLEGLRSVAVVEAIQIAAETDKTVRLEP